MRCRLINKELQKIGNLEEVMLTQKNLDKLSEKLRFNKSVNGNKRTIILDIENTLVTQIEIQSEHELKELRKMENYSKNYIEIRDSKSLQVFMVRPYTFEFIRAIEPFFEIVIYSHMHYQVIEQICSQLEEILNGPIKEYLQGFVSKKM